MGCNSLRIRAQEEMDGVGLKQTILCDFQFLEFQKAICIIELANVSVQYRLGPQLTLKKQAMTWA